MQPNCKKEKPTQPGQPRATWAKGWEVKGGDVSLEEVKEVKGDSSLEKLKGGKGR